MKRVSRLDARGFEKWPTTVQHDGYVQPEEQDKKRKKTIGKQRKDCPHCLKSFPVQRYYSIEFHECCAKGLIRHGNKKY